MNHFTPLLMAISLFWLANASASDLMLATEYHDHIEVKHYLISEKYDGIRARWDGLRFVSRNNKTIGVPDCMKSDMPDTVLDGELWLGRQTFEQMVGLINRTQTSCDDWRKVKFMVFDAPLLDQPFAQRADFIASLASQNQHPHFRAAPQWRVNNRQDLFARLDELVHAGAEGLMLHHQDARYRNGRSNDLLKLKRFKDAEARVIAYVQGKGKYAGMMGALLVETPNGQRFKIGTGFSDALRRNPPPLGSIITYKYFALTVNKVPRFASFLRIKPALIQD